jgi:tRNA 5-methylaminomethyl-2-thiouridine biosynthesis bifunctional protein
MAGASGNLRAALFTRVSPFDQPHNRFHNSAFHTAIGCLSGREYFRQYGLLSLLNSKEQQQWSGFLGANPIDSSFMQLLAPEDASEIARHRIISPAIHYPQSGLIDPGGLAGSVQANPLIECKLGREIVSLSRADEGWLLCAADGEEFHSSVVIFCVSHGTRGFSFFDEVPIKTIGGQVSYLPSNSHSSMIDKIISGDGYLTPAAEGYHVVGATYHLKSTSCIVSIKDHAANLQKIQNLSPDFEQIFDCQPTSLNGRTAVRSNTNDYLPIVGPIPLVDFYRGQYSDLRHGNPHIRYPEARYHQGLFANVAHGSKGFTQAWLAAELLYSLVRGLPLPVDRGVYQAIHPARFLIRKLRRGK